MLCVHSDNIMMDNIRFIELARSNNSLVFFFIQSLFVYRKQLDSVTIISY